MPGIQCQICCDRFLKSLYVMCLGMLTGCEPIKTNTVPASGVVTYQGQPVKGAEVAFIPKVASSDAKPARGTTDADGQFTVKSYFSPKGAARGVRPGEYTVTIRKVAPPEGMTLDEWQIANMEDPRSVAPLRSLVPEAYADG